MALTKHFRETIRQRAQQEPRFRKTLLREAIELMLSGDEKTGRAILRNIISTPRLAFGGSKMRHPSQPAASCECSAQKATLRQETCLASSLIFRHRKA
jgi:hypothetical protein